MGSERTKREYDLRVLNCVSEGEYESRMVVWDNLVFSTGSVESVANFVDTAFNKLQSDVKQAGKELSVTYNEFVTMANEEINYIKVNVADSKAQIFWYAAVFVMICAIVALYI
ncbi:thiamine-phosphate diphosphorylase [Vibrio sp. LaRot3]|uniref:thiamine-phosphate diphosphorylase n=1 Tax=Vibrio sp. LaRot3 TaxID=2998829 RepID=UPI0022CDCAE7|nr:thiamine-phosphate diphosphorylase [Vibrio sp. LaRot3]MDA0149641.1 thiamine-phosphate diphosphorylase [Vibrio sp. LaRot3]